MAGGRKNSAYVEKIEFLPDDFLLDVSRAWCSQVINYLHERDEYSDLLYTVNSTFAQTVSFNEASGRISKYVKISVEVVKELVNVYGGETLLYVIPYNYNEVASQFLYEKLGDFKDKIEYLVCSDQIDEAFLLIHGINDSYLKRLSLFYMKFIYNTETEAIIEKVKKIRTKTVAVINGFLY